MVRNIYKQKYEELKNQLDIDKKIDKHKESYIYIPFSWKAIGIFFALLGSVGLAIANFFLIISVGYTYKVWELLGADNPDKVYHSFSQLIILYPLIGEYILIGLCFICLTSLIKGGFDKVKSYKDGGLIFGLIVGLIVGLNDEF